MTTRCPVCDQRWIPPDLFVDLNTNTIFANGSGVHVTPQIAEAMAYIVGRLPLPATVDGLALAIWGNNEWPETYRKSVHVYVCMIRKVLNPRRFTIEVDGHRCYVVRRINQHGPLNPALFTTGVAKSSQVNRH